MKRLITVLICLFVILNGCHAIITKPSPKGTIKQILDISNKQTLIIKNQAKDLKKLCINEAAFIKVATILQSLETNKYEIIKEDTNGNQSEIQVRVLQKENFSLFKPTSESVNQEIDITFKLEKIKENWLINNIIGSIQ